MGERGGYPFAGQASQAVRFALTLNPDKPGSPERPSEANSDEDSVPPASKLENMEERRIGAKVTQGLW